MSAKNNCHFIGNIGRDAEIRHTSSGIAVATFPIAAESGYGEKKVTTWIRCNLWGKRAEGGLVQYLVKGQPVAVSGEIKLNQYVDKEGNEKTSLDMNVDDVALIGKKPEQSNEHRAPEQKEYGKPVDKNDPFADTGDDDDVGF